MTKTTLRTLPLWLAPLIISLGGCADYDPPPEVSLLNPPEGRWLKETPLILEFTEPIDAATLAITIWPMKLGVEGEVKPEVEAVAAECTLAAPCEGLSIELDEEKRKAAITHTDILEPWLGKSMLMDVHGGLSDLAGRQRKVRTRFEFQVTPVCGAGPVDVPMNSGVITLFADLTDIIPGLFLRMYADFGFVPETGETWMVGLVAKLEEGTPPNTIDPTKVIPYGDPKGWAVFLTGQLMPCVNGEFVLETDPFDMNVLVMGFIDTTMENFQVTGRLILGGHEDGRDLFEGLMLSTRILIDDEEIGSAAAATTGFGMWDQELPADLPRMCSELPCADLDALGADCQIPYPWPEGPICASE